MKKSEMYHLLQFIVLGVKKVEELSSDERLSLIFMLKKREDDEKSLEEYLAKKEAEEQHAKDAQDGKVAMGA